MNDEPQYRICWQVQGCNSDCDDEGMTKERAERICETLNATGGEYIQYWIELIS